MCAFLNYAERKYSEDERYKGNRRRERKRKREKYMGKYNKKKKI